MQFFKRSLLAMVTLLATTAAVAQQPGQLNMNDERPEISDTELAQFVEIMPSVNAIQMQYQQEMVTAVQDNEIEVQRFNELARAQQDPNLTVEANEMEMKAFNSAMAAVQAIQQNLNQDVEAAIAESELSMSRFQEIAMAVNSDQSLQQKVQQMMQSKEGQQ